jgi:hypothetical protein
LLLVTAASLVGVYPREKKLYLFLLPAFLILLAAGAQSLWTWAAVLTRRRRPARTLAQLAAVVLAATALQAGLRTDPPWRQSEMLEDYASAFRHLRENAGPTDLVWVPACSREPFKIYSRMLGWQPARVAYGETGWPCCPRGDEWLKNGKGPGAVGPDIEAKITPGRVWAVYTLRDGQWSYVGYDEPAVFRAQMTKRGCPENSEREFTGVLVMAFECGAKAPRGPKPALHSAGSRGFQGGS